MDTNFSQFNEVFFEESLELIEVAEQTLVKIDLGHVSSEEINAIFRCAHSIKSSSGMLGFNSISHFTHIMEDYLDRVRNNTISLTKDNIDILLKSLDCLKSMFVDLKNNITPDDSAVKALEAEYTLLIENKAENKSENKEESEIHLKKNDESPNVQYKNSEKNIETTTIRVTTEKVDALINMVGELVITQSMLSQIINHFDLSKLEALKEGLAHLEHNCRELQENVMRIRMLPVSNVFNRFPRMVRDVSSMMGKQVDLKISGENTELDKSILEKIMDPMMHLVRNALDHGFEYGPERKQAGKPEIAQLRLHAFHQGSNVFIEVSDDGRGLNEEKILEKAIKVGMAKPDDVLTSAQIIEFIFAPGFSTVDKVTDISGRGVGMDVVRKNVESLGGKILIKSEFGKGTTFTICLPLTMAILDGQLVRIGGSVYIIPLIHMIETIQIKKEFIHRITENTEVYNLRDQYIPIIRLYEIFNIDEKDLKLENHLLVVIKLENKFYGIIINELLQLQQVVIKSFEKNYKKIEGISGATILGDGTVALILDTEGIVCAAARKGLLNTPVNRVA